MFFHREETVKVKICGIIDIETAIQAVDAGADALGFVFARESKRYIDPEQAEEIIASLPPNVQTVGVFVDTPMQDIKNIAGQCKLDIIQLHNDDRTNDCRELNLPVIRCLKISDRLEPGAIINLQAHAILLDTYHPHMAGGTGKPFDWSVARDIKCSKPLILAGGLDPDNVRAAIETVKPCAVDVSSGVETKGVKDISKIKSFIRRAKEVQL